MQIPVAEGLFTWPSDSPRLIGSVCRDCGAVAFPSAVSCARCTSQDVGEELLERRGTLWSWTIQGFAPKSPPYAADADPADFEPYGVGYVELPGQLLVESRLTVADPDALAIGMAMELVVEPFMTDGNGDEILAFAFRPVEDPE